MSKNETPFSGQSGTRLTKLLIYGSCTPSDPSPGAGGAGIPAVGSGDDGLRAKDAAASDEDPGSGNASSGGAEAFMLFFGWDFVELMLGPD